MSESGGEDLATMQSGKTTWAIVTGEYPPQPGGVSDYTWEIAHALFEAGDDVHVFAPGHELLEFKSPVAVHRLSDRFGAKGLLELYAGLNKLPEPRRALVQFVAQSFGMHGANIPFALTLQSLHGFPLWVMFHEFAISDDRSMSLAHRTQGLLTRLVATRAARAADKTFVSTPAWDKKVQACGGRTPRWLPIPSNLPLQVDEGEVKRVSNQYRRRGKGELIGHFGTYRMAESRATLEAGIPAILTANETRRMLLLGRGSEDFSADLIRRWPAFADRISGCGELNREALACHLTACDVLLQPYPDGVTTRRGSLIAALALGVPIITTGGESTEAFWAASGAVLLVPPNDVHAIVSTLEDLLQNSTSRASIRERARTLYFQLFAIEHTISRLREIGN